MDAEPISDAIRTPIRVVVVDDSPEVCFLLGTVLEMDRRFEIVGEAHSAVAGVDLVAEAQPQLVLVDLQLGGRDGMWLIKKLRSHHHDAALAVVTASSSDHEHAAAFEAGADSVHNKMSMTSTMVDELAETVARRGVVVAA